MVEGAGVLFRKGDINELSSKINCLLNDKIRYAEIAKRCGERSLKYDIKMMVENYIAEYYKVFTE